MWFGNFWTGSSGQLERSDACAGQFKTKMDVLNVLQIAILRAWLASFFDLFFQLWIPGLECIGL